MKNKSLMVLTVTLTVLAVTGAACGPKSGGEVATGTPIATVTVNNLTATLSNATGQLKQGEQDVMLAFKESSGKPVDVGAVSLNFHMPAMGGMSAMNEAATLTTTSTPGVYNGKVNIAMAGEWQGQLAFEGPAGKGKATFSATAR